MHMAHWDKQRWFLGPGRAPALAAECAHTQIQVNSCAMVSSAELLPGRQAQQEGDVQQIYLPTQSTANPSGCMIYFRPRSTS